MTMHPATDTGFNKEFGGENTPLDLGPVDIEEVKKAILCLRKKREAEGN